MSRLPFEFVLSTTFCKARVASGITVAYHSHPTPCTLCLSILWPKTRVSRENNHLFVKTDLILAASSRTPGRRYLVNALHDMLRSLVNLSLTKYMYIVMSECWPLSRAARVQSPASVYKMASSHQDT